MECRCRIDEVIGALTSSAQFMKNVQRSRHKISEKAGRIIIDKETALW